MTTLFSQASRTREGGQLASNLFLRKVCLRNLPLPRLRRENFANERFGEASALRSVSIATREAQNCGKLVGFAVCLRDLLSPTWAAKFLRTEFLARHRRHAAFRSRRRWPKIVVSWLHSRLVVGTFCFQGLALEPSSFQVAP